jgi:hypothetical protein
VLHCVLSHVSLCFIFVSLLCFLVVIRVLLGEVCCSHSYVSIVSVVSVCVCLRPLVPLLRLCLSPSCPSGSVRSVCVIMLLIVGSQASVVLCQASQASQAHWSFLFRPGFCQV